MSDMERSATLENTAKEIANYISTKCVHPVSNRPYTTNQIRDAMKKAEISVQPTSARSVKQQFLDCVRIIQEKKVLDIERAKMELAIVLPTSDQNVAHQITQQLKEEAGALIETIIDNQRIHFLIDPSQYRVVDNISKEEQDVKLEILRQTVKQEGDVDVSLELERNTLLQQSRNDNERTNLLQTVPETSRAETDLSKNMAQLRLDENYLNQDSDGEEKIETAESNRKKNKKAAKKSKKAKRREKEEASIRKERIDAERARQEERNFRLGLNSEGKPQTAESAGADDEQRKSCNTCGGSFTASEYRSHFRSDWHRYNMKLKMKGVSPIDEKEFLLIDSDAFFTDQVL